MTANETETVFFTSTFDANSFLISEGDYAQSHATCTYVMPESNAPVFFVTVGTSGVVLIDSTESDHGANNRNG